MSFEEQIMSKGKHASIFSPQMEAIVFIILQTFFSNTHGFENWGYHSHIFCWGIFYQARHLEQSCTSESINALRQQV